MKSKMYRAEENIWNTSVRQWFEYRLYKNFLKLNKMTKRSIKQWGNIWMDAFEKKART
jgi:hypothetical protein